MRLQKYISIFRQNYSITFTVVKSSPKIWATSVIFKNLPKLNKDPIGYNYPNLVTLVSIYFSRNFLLLSHSRDQVLL
jgi:hypothetical protein